MIKELLEEIKVYDCENLTKIRLGNKGDGGYVVAKELCEATDTLYSVGIGDDVGFELDFAKQFPNAKIKMYDPTIDDIPHKHKNFEFNKREFNNADISNKPSALKMDIEGDEWHSVYNLLTDSREFICGIDGERIEVTTFASINRFLSAMNQIVIEFHILHHEARVGLSPYFNDMYNKFIDTENSKIFSKYYNVIKEMNKHFYCFHIHANNSLPITEYDGYKFPPLLEMSFVRKDIVTGATLSDELFPVVGLDYPNKADRPDISGHRPFGNTEGILISKDGFMATDW